MGFQDLNQRSGLKKPLSDRGLCLTHTQPIDDHADLAGTVIGCKIKARDQMLPTTSLEA